MSNLLVIASAVIGLLWGFVLFFPSPAEKDAIRKASYIQVYEGEIKCEKALDTWVCGKPKANYNGER